MRYLAGAFFMGAMVAFTVALAGPITVAPLAFVIFVALTGLGGLCVEGHL